MKIFLDTAHIPAIEKWAAMGIIDGVTTNPSHLSKEGQNHASLDPGKLIKKICALLPNGQISVQVTESDPEKVYEQAKNLVELAPNIVVKIPCHQDYYGVIKQLVAEGVPVNITLVFSVFQGLMMCKLGVRYISPFIGRLDDAGVSGDGIAMLGDLRTMVDQYCFETQILAASLRTPEHLQAALLLGADCATLSPELLEKVVAHPLTDAGMQKFAQDWQKLGIKKFL
jgi:transaldolase